MNAVGYRLRKAGVTVTRVAEEAGVVVHAVSNATNGHQRLTENLERAIRRLLPKDDADEVIRMCYEAREARGA